MVEALVGLVAMATEAPERQALQVMGGQACQACDDLRGRLRAIGAPISADIEAVAERVLAPERLDDRLRAFSVLRRELAATAADTMATSPDPATRDMLATLRDVQLAQAGWANRRAEEFAATRVPAEFAGDDNDAVEAANVDAPTNAAADTSSHARVAPPDGGMPNDLARAADGVHAANRDGRRNHPVNESSATAPHADRADEPLQASAAHALSPEPPGAESGAPVDNGHGPSRGRQRHARATGGDGPTFDDADAGGEDSGGTGTRR